VRDFERSLAAFAARGVAVMGASTDDAATNAAFAAAQGLRYPLLSDPDGAACRALGILSERGTARRTTFLIGADGRIVRVWEDVSLGPDGRSHAEDVLARAAAGA
jgi:peroxiredoxin Q/BCP